MVAYIGLGSNLGDRRAMLDKAIKTLRSDRDIDVLNLWECFEESLLADSATEIELLRRSFISAL